MWWKVIALSNCLLCLFGVHLQSKYRVIVSYSKFWVYFFLIEIVGWVSLMLLF